MMLPGSRRSQTVDKAGPEATLLKNHVYLNEQCPVPCIPAARPHGENGVPSESLNMDTLISVIVELEQR
jgi:hypothetical protein